MITPPTDPNHAPPASRPALGQHIPALDGLRGLAILLVMLYHQCLLTSTGLADRVFARVMNFGWCGVDLFFVLSGFLITGILLDTKSTKGYFPIFYARRMLRIFPLYYAVVFFSLVILPALPHAKHASFGRIAGDEWCYWLYLSNFSIARAGAWRHAILDVSWSLAIEEQFYLVWPLIVLFLSNRNLQRTCLAIFLAAFACRSVLVALGTNPIAVYVSTACRIDALAAGAWVAVTLRLDHARFASIAGAARKLILPVALGFLVLAYCDGSAYSQDAPIMQTAGYGTLAVLFAMLLVIVVTAGPGTLCAKIFDWQPLRSLGKYSYALYLFHLPLRALVRDTVLPESRFMEIMGSRIPGQLLFFLVSTLLTFAAAWLSWNLYEKHFLRLKRYFEYDRGPTDGGGNIVPWNPFDSAPGSDPTADLPSPSADSATSGAKRHLTAFSG